MAHTLSAKKRIRQSEKKRIRNKAAKSNMKTAVKRYLGVVESGDKEAAKTELTNVTSIINKTASKGVIHKNAAARRVSRLTARYNALAK